jgi:diguanylate cyclase (GGDEF)-like protein
LEHVLRFVRKHRGAVLAAALLLTAAVTYANFVFETDMEMSYLYFVLIIVVAWLSTRPASVGFSALAGIAAVAADVFHGTSSLGLWAGGSMMIGSFVSAAFVVNASSTLMRRISRLASHDTLTRIPSSAYFHRMLSAELHRSLRYSRPLTLAYMDVDDFKEVNDSLGHSAGDTVLRAIADAAGQEIRDLDVLGRLGGDEFGLLLPETTIDQALPLFERIERCISDLATEKGWPISISIGASGLPEGPAESCTEDSLLHHADMLMYQAKREGKGRTVAALYPSREVEAASS